MMTSRSLICLLENQNGGKLQKVFYSSLKQFVFTKICDQVLGALAFVFVYVWRNFMSCQIFGDTASERVEDTLDKSLFGHLLECDQ
jgi:hypothetical protein